jgi:hypothetical protein
MKGFQGCPGSRTIEFNREENAEGTGTARIPSQLRQWPIQLHLVSPAAPYFQGADVLLAADCVPFAMGNFHGDILKGMSLAIACPKLDDGQDMYVEKLRALFDEARINTLTVIIMQVPCCHGLVSLAAQALRGAQRKAPLKYVIVSLQGDVLQEEWIEA